MELIEIISLQAFCLVENSLTALLQSQRRAILPLLYGIHISIDTQPKVPHSSSGQTANPAIVYESINLNSLTHRPPDQTKATSHATQLQSRRSLKENIKGAMDSTEPCTTTQSKPFACPYFRLDPIRHIECLSRKVNRIQDLKQHLVRRHYVQKFESQATDDNIEGVSQSAQRSLRVRVDRRLPPEGQWLTVWHILFKGIDPGLGPYLGNTEEEIIGITREIYRRRSNEAVSRFLKQEGLPASRIDLFQGLMMGLLEVLKECSNEQQSDSGLGKLPETSLDKTLKHRQMHAETPLDGTNPPKSTDKGESQKTSTPSSQVLSPTVKNDSLLLHELSGLGDWGSISDRSIPTLYNESSVNEMPVLMHFEELDCTFYESPSNSTGHDFLSSDAATTDSSRCSEPLFRPPKRKKLEKSYLWKCHECNFQNSFTSGSVCQNYPCQHKYYPEYCERSYSLIDDCLSVETMQED
ncbi:hypothetical protein DER45DRAFT_46337 [Fusarium avenaceum]|nr:hypothetical protein DER45DRAFT_46337 [Fusarium avenaceum]